MVCLYRERAQLYELRAFLENLEHKVTIIIHFVVFKIDSWGDINMSEM
jgi:hypothetical protein